MRARTPSEYVEDTDHFCDSCGGQTVGGHCGCSGAGPEDDSTIRATDPYTCAIYVIDPETGEVLDIEVGNDEQ